MSRAPQLSDRAMQLMHQRATDVGLDPYGSSEDEMHRIDHPTLFVPSDIEPNEWQKLWKFFQIEKYLDQSLDPSSTEWSGDTTRQQRYVENDSMKRLIVNCKNTL